MGFEELRDYVHAECASFVPDESEERVSRYARLVSELYHVRMASI